jgi:hypothetical protein
VESASGYYVTQKTKLLTDFQENFVKFGRSIMISHFGDDLADTILKETYQEYEALIPRIPYNGENDIGATKLIESTWSLALYRVLKMHGKTVEEAGQISCEILSAGLNSIPLPVRRPEKFFSKSIWQKSATESQKRLYPEANVWSFVEGDSVEFDYGMDFTECDIRKFFHAQGADELVPYMCLHDSIVAKAFGIEMVRTTSLLDGDEKCDLRYKRIR